jgi:hypothetical protein
MKNLTIEKQTHMLASACVEGWANGVGSKDNIKK